MLNLRRASHLGVTLLTLLITTATSQLWAPTAQAVPSQLPITFTNTTGSSKAVHLYVLGTHTITGRQGYVDAGAPSAPGLASAARPP